MTPWIRNVRIIMHNAQVESLRRSAWALYAFGAFVVVAIVAVALSGCGSAQQRIVDATTVQANAMHELALEASVVIKEQCVAAYESASAADVPAIDRACLPATKAYLKLRAIWTTEAALLAMQPVDVSRLATIQAEATAVAGQLADAMGAFR